MVDPSLVEGLLCRHRVQKETLSSATRAGNDVGAGGAQSCRRTLTPVEPGARVHRFSDQLQSLRGNDFLAGSHAADGQEHAGSKPGCTEQLLMPHLRKDVPAG